jgi:membrane-bound serine protease (ClpP class)
MRHGCWILLLAVLTAGTPSAQAVVFTLEIDDVIHPVIAEYVIQGLAQANEEDATAVIIQMSTPGGFDTSMREIIEKILRSKIPVLIYVGPSGARAASAGFFILLSGDLAIMAPGTNTGAAHPVPLGGGKVDEVMQKKIENDAAAYIRSFVAQRGRNTELAEKGVLDSLSFTEEEALAGNLIDGLAQDLNEILTRFDGKEVRRFDGEKQTLKLKDETLRAIEMTVRQKVLAKVLNPNIALILGLIGLLGLYVEFSNPGLIFPGVAGGVCVFLALVAFNILPINFLGVVMLLAAIVLFVLEAKITSYGLLASLGIAVMVLGSLILIDSPLPEMRVKLVTALGITLPFAAITIFLMRLVIRAHRNKSVTGDEGMVGEIGTALTDIGAEGKVQVHGEIWQASSPQPIESGNRVRVVAVEGLNVKVTPESGSGPFST